MFNEFNYEIVEHITTISSDQKTNFAIELNRISYNKNPPKFDLRKWNKAEKKMLKGLTLTDEETETLYKALKEYFERS